jgi:hypothetical protein
MTTNTNSPISKFKLRVSPWLTDSCVVFLNNLFKWLPIISTNSLSVLEFGGGNSTLFFLQKGIKVVCVENDDNFIELLINFANLSGLKASVVDIKNFDSIHIVNNDLTLVRASDYNTEINQSECKEIENIIRSLDWSFIVNDGIARKQVIQEILSSNSQSIIILDNVEHCANWGHLDRSSAKPKLIELYREILRSDNYQYYIFEQIEGRQGHGIADVTGWESPHRWASGILWNKNHVLSQLMITNLGFPIVNMNGINNMDIKTVEERCPFDWQNNKWLKDGFPIELDQKLKRKFD